MCIVIEIGVIFGKYYYHGYLLVTLYYFRICFNRKAVDVLYLDFATAFNKVPHKKLLEK